MAETVAFLFADLEGSTRMLASLGADAYGELLTAYREVVSEAVVAEGGRVVDREGDGVFLVLPTAAGAVRAALRAQRALVGRSWPDDAEVTARMGVHAGEVEVHPDGYVGLDVHRAARIAGAAWGGQVLVSEAARALAADGLPDDVGLRDLGEHRLKDLDRVEHLHQLVIPGLREDFPPLRTLEGTPNNLPEQPTSFVGRERELDEVIGLIRDSRLVTSIGVGGSGKTRVALRAIAELIAEFPGGVWFVELGAITDPELVDGALLEALGLPQPSRMGQREAAIEHLSGRTAALLLDNCEHLIDAAADLAAAVVSGAPDCTVVTTSREVLGVSGEVVYGLRSMDLPSETDVADVEALCSSDAVRLFVERASDVSPGFAVTEDNADAVAEICRRLDGMPLALELAAARLRTFGPDKIAELLDQRFRLLTGGSRTALPRQQTLTAAIEWSYRLLDPTEQAFFCRLSVFQGGFTYEATLGVTTDGDVDEFAVLELLPALVDKSLVVADEELGEVRYRLLETLRQFARDRLDETGLGDDVRRRHTAYFRDLAVEAGRNIVGPDERMWRRRIGVELGNLRQAMTWSLEAGEPTDAMTIAIEFSRFALARSQWSEALSWIERTIAAAGEDAPPHLLAAALSREGALRSTSGDHEGGLAQIERAIAMFERLEAEGTDPALLRTDYPVAMMNRGTLHFQRGTDNTTLARLWRQAVEVARRVGNAFVVAGALSAMAHHIEPGADLDDARRLFAEAEEASRALGSAQRMATINGQRAFFEFQAGDLEAARDAWEASIRHAEEGELETASLFGRICLAACEVEIGSDRADRSVAEDLRALFDDPDVRASTNYHQTLLVLRAGIDAAAERFERVAVAAGASHAESERGTPVRWDLVDHFERVTGAAREALGDEAFEAAAAEGEAMSHEEIADFLAAD